MTDLLQPLGDASTGFQIVEHTADWALRVFGKDLRELFNNAAIGMSSLLVPDLSAITPNETRKLELEAGDVETLLVDWLSELAYWAEDEALVFIEFILMDISPFKLKATVSGGRVKHLIKHIKAVTYHDLQVKKTLDGLEATIVFDV